MSRIPIILLCLVSSLLTYGHGDVHERISIINDEIVASPDDPMLYIKRAALYLEDSDYDETILDVEKAQMLSGEKFSPALMIYAKMCYKMGTYEMALIHIDDFLSYEQDHVLGIITKAKILSALDNKLAAAEYYKRAIEKTTTHLPENFLDLINVLMQDGQMAEAYKVYEAGQDKFGNLIVLDLKAMEIAEAMNDYTTLFRVLDKIIDAQPRKERWHYKKAEICLEIGEIEQAEKQLSLATKCIDELPYRIKVTPAMQKLTADISNLLAQSEKTITN